VGPRNLVMILCYKFKIGNKKDYHLVKENEKDIYNDNILVYSSIVREKIKDKEIILECIKMLEYFEDYEKCEHLLRIINEIDNSKTSQ